MKFISIQRTTNNHDKNVENVLFINVFLNNGFTISTNRQRIILKNHPTHITIGTCSTMQYKYIYSHLCALVNISKFITILYLFDMQCKSIKSFQRKHPTMKKKKKWKMKTKKNGLFVEDIIKYFMCFSLFGAKVRFSNYFIYLCIYIIRIRVLYWILIKVLYY